MKGAISMYDFDKIHLLFLERLKLFLMRFKKKVSSTFLGKHAEYLLLVKFVAANHSDCQNKIGEFIPDGTFSLTDKYHRYLVYRRHEFMKIVTNSIIFPIMVSVIASVVTSILTVLLLKQLEL